jgi:WD40 repeat protein
MVILHGKTFGSEKNITPVASTNNLYELVGVDITISAGDRQHLTRSNMRGRQIGTWIGRREAGEGALEEVGVVEERNWRSWVRRWLPAALLVMVILAVGWWVRREGAYRRFMMSLRDGKVRYIEFQPYANSKFVTVSDERGIQAVADCLRDARAMGRRYVATGPADCEMRIVMEDGSVKRLALGASGPTRSGGNLAPASYYVTVKGDGWERAVFAGGMSGVYMRLPVTAQLPFSSIPVAGGPIPRGGIVAGSAVVSGEVDPSTAQTFIERGQLGPARRMLLRALAGDANNPAAKQWMGDVNARIRMRLPNLTRELERGLPESLPTLDREKYIQLREKLMELTLMMEPGDRKVAELRQRLSNGRPEARPEGFKELVRLAGGATERYGIADFAWSPDGASIAACGEDGRVKVWDTLSGELMASFPAAVGKKIYFSADGSRVWVWNDQGRTWWDVTTGKASEESKVADDGVKHEFRVYVSASDKVGMTRSKDGQPYEALAGHAGAVVLAKISPDGDQVASFGEDKVLSIWGEGLAGAVALLVQLSPYERFRRLGELEGPSVFLPDGSILTLRVGAAPAPRAVERLKPEKFAISVVNLPSMAARVEMAARDQRMLVEMRDKTMVVVQPELKKVYPCPKPEGSCGRAAIAPDGKTIAIGNVDGSVGILNVESGAAFARLVCSPMRNRNWAAVSYSSDGGWVMACGVGFVAVWNVGSREQVFYSEKAVVEGVAASFTPDGKGLALIYRDGGLRKLKSSLKESEAVGWDQSAVRDVTFSGDGRWIASVNKAGEAEVFDATAAGVTHTGVKVPAKDQEAMRFSEDGNVLAVKAEDGSMRLIEVPSGRELRRLTLKGDKNWLEMPCSFSADGKYLIAGPMVWGAE